jgi:membrane protease subunit HflC
MDQGKKLVFLVLAAVTVMVASASMFTVKEWERAVLFRLGEIVKTDYDPGLHFKIPFINNVRKFDGRILTLDADPERYLTAEKKNVIVDSFVKWKIDDVSAYYTAMGGDQLRANMRLSQIIKDGLRGEFGKRTIQEVVSGERQQIMDVLTLNAKRQAASLGIKVIDVRIKRIDLSEEVSSSVFRRMEAERDRTAKELRSQGAEAAERIRADADRQRTVTLAEAYRDAEQIRGEGDAKAADTYARAYTKDAEFYAFYRSINAYQSSFNNKADVMVLEPDADFFKYFNNMKGASK